MNLLEHYIIEIHSITNISNEFEQKCGYSPNEPLYNVDLTYDCYGTVTRDIRTFYETELNCAKEKGYFMA